MKRLFIAITLLYLFFACTDRQNPSEPEIDGPKTGTEIRGPISGILEKKNSPFYVKQNIYVDSLNSLKIEAGVELNFDDSTKFDIFGTIISVGDTSNFITYTSQSDSWFGINLENSNNVNRFEFCIINNVQVLDYHISEFGALALYRSRAVISNCVFSNNFAMNGGGISIISSDAEIKNNLFIKNHAVTLGGAIISVESTSRIYNNTIFRNSTTNYGGGLVLVDPVFDDVQNNIFYLNSNQTGDPRISVYTGDSTNYNLKYNFLWSGDLNPQFISEENLRLQIISPCIDQGNPGSEYNDYDGTRNDQGAYGGPLGNW